MKTGVLIDSQTRKYVCDCLEGAEVPEGYEHVDSIPPDGLFEPIYTESGEWVNGLTQEEIDELKNPTMDIETLRKEKLLEIRSSCENEISLGFQSNVTLVDTGIAHYYGLDAYDQNNLNCKLNMMNAFPDRVELEWKVKGGEFVLHTREEFYEICMEAELYIETLRKKCALLVKTIQEAQTAEEIQNIVW